MTTEPAVPTASPVRSGHRFTLGTFRASELARTYLQEVLDSGRLTYGPLSRRFEEEFAALHGARHAILSSSGTSALHLALAALKELHGWDDGDEVILPAVTFVATFNVVVHCRMTPVLADIEPVHYEIDPGAVARAITPRTRAVIPVHLFGQPADMAPILELAAHHGLKIIEDSCETMFASYRGRRCGSLGDIGCFSTYAAHLLVTGVGGINTTSDPDAARLIRSLANHGRDPSYFSIDDDDGLEPERLREIVARRFHFTSPGFSNRITELEAALGLAQLEEHRAMIERRRANASRLSRRLAPARERLQLPRVRDRTEHSFMMYPLVLRAEPKRRLVEALELAGVETRDMLPLTNQPVVRRYLGPCEHRFPVARWINECGFYIGCHQDLTREHIDELAALVLEHLFAPSDATG